MLPGNNIVKDAGHSILQFIFSPNNLDKFVFHG